MKILLISCIDPRHDGEVGKAIRGVTGVENKFYHCTRACGAGVLSNGLTDSAQGLLSEVKALVPALGVSQVFISVHGSSTEDTKGCAGYELCGHGHVYESPETSRVFSHNELMTATKRLQDEGITIPVRAFYVTFGSRGENLVEEVVVQ